MVLKLGTLDLSGASALLPPDAELRRHGKTVIGVSPNGAVSKDFSALCDRFLRYEALTSSVEPTGAESISEVRAELGEAVRDNPEGLLGSELKTTLRRVLSSNFDESTYGFMSFASFLRKMDDIVRVIPAPAAGGDLRVFPASARPPGAGDLEDSGATRLVRQANLHKLRYDADAPRRRRALSHLFDVAAERDGSFTFGATES